MPHEQVEQAFSDVSPLSTGELSSNQRVPVAVPPSGLHPAGRGAHRVHLTLELCRLLLLAHLGGQWAIALGCRTGMHSHSRSAVCVVVGRAGALTMRPAKLPAAAVHNGRSFREYGMWRGHAGTSDGRLA